jgi:glycosyltransferase involved in cell wall biosynthesis
MRRECMTSKIKTQVKALAERAAVASKLRRLSLARASFHLRRQARRGLGLAPRPYGVNLVAYIRAEMGLGQAARGMAAALQAAGIPFGIVNFERGNVSAQTNLAWRHKEVERPGYDVTLLCVNPDNGDNLRATVSNSLLGNRYVIGNWFWELPELPDEWMKEFSLVNEVWAGSRFIQDAVALKSPVPVVRIPPVVEVSMGNSLSRDLFGVPERRFLFLCVCDTMSVLERKNPLGAVRAFKRAFGPAETRAALVLKFNNPGFASPELEKLREEIRGHENIYTVERVLNREEMTGLLAVADCLVSLHRSEGFGLVPAEAMRLGKPVILTNWSGNTDYMTPENSIGIDYELVSLGRDYGSYKAHQCWAEPDIEQAAHWMKKLVEEPALAEEIGRRGRATIETRFSPEAVGGLIKQRLEYIRRNA